MILLLIAPLPFVYPKSEGEPLLLDRAERTGSPGQPLQQIDLRSPRLRQEPRLRHGPRRRPAVALEAEAARWREIQLPIGSPHHDKAVGHRRYADARRMHDLGSFGHFAKGQLRAP